MIGLALPASAWEFTPLPVCTLTEESGSGSVVVIYDPRQKQAYSIMVTSPVPWPDASSFSMRFEGQRGLTISTDRHRLSNGGRTLTVTDTGFGNVLNGLEFNDRAVAVSGGSEVGFPLDGAAPEVQALRACAQAPSV